MKNIRRALLAVLLALMIGMLIPVEAQSDATDVVIATNTPAGLVAPEPITVLAEATPEPVPVLVPDTQTPVLVGDGGIVLVTESDKLDLKSALIGVFAIALIVSITILLRQAITQLALSVPLAVYNTGMAVVRTGLTELQVIADATPATWDDPLVRVLTSKITELEQEISQLRSQQSSHLQT